MEKLELKHLAPYLPYGVKSMDVNTNEVRLVTLLHATYDRETVGHNHLIYDGLLMSKHLLVLHNLSDLTKPITHEGQTFVPVDALNSDGEVAFEYGKNAYGKDYLCFYYADGLDSLSFSDIEGIRSKLLEWHFDVFGLIDKNLAIDINTLNQ